MRRAVIFLLLLFVIGSRAAAQSPASLVAPAAPAASSDGFSAQEIRRIQAHGPWPQPVLRDPSNRVSGNADAIALGRALFFDVRLSGKGDMSCATCHQPQQGFTDGRDRAQGSGSAKKRLDRNTPTLWNAALARWFGWDGGSDSLWGFSIRPILDPDELAATPQHVASLLRTDATLACQYRNAFGAPRTELRKRRASDIKIAGSHDERVLVEVAKALAAYVETLNSGKSEFDQLHDALARGDMATAARYPAAARRGLSIFTGRGQCSVCHFGPNFSNGEFHDVGIPYLAAPGRVDAGRHGGIARVKQDQFNLLGGFSDDASGVAGSRTRHVTQNHTTYGQFKVPSLRNVELTAPYMHNGSLATLRDVVRHYSAIPEDRLHQDGEALLKPLQLTDSEADDLVAFLTTLTSRELSASGAVAVSSIGSASGTATASCTPRR